MERKTSQNLEFSQNLSAKTEICHNRHLHNPYTLSRPSCASGGDNSAVEKTAHCTSRNSSYHNLSLCTNVSDEEMMTAHTDRSTLLSLKSVACGSSTSAISKLNASANTAKRRSKSGTKLKSELNKYKKELKDYNNTTKDLEEKYLKINYELSEMQQKHDRFVAHHKTKGTTSNETDSYTADSSSMSSGASSTRSEFSLKRKCTQMFRRGSSFMKMIPSSPQQSIKNYQRNISQYNQSTEVVDNNILRHKKYNSNHNTPLMPAVAEMSNRLSKGSKSCTMPHKRSSNNKENETPSHIELESSNNYRSRSQTAGLKDIYKVLRTVLDTNQKSQSVHKGNNELKELQTTITSLQKEQAQFRNIIQQQQDCLHDYHSRCIKAQHIMQSQQHEIEKLNSNNQQLETEITSGIDKLRVKIDTKIRDVSQFPQMMRDEQTKCEKITKENSILGERLRLATSEASQLKLKMEELGRRKNSTITRLKMTERDLKIFKNYNTALKQEKRKLIEEMQKLREQLDSIQNANKRSITRQREQNEKQRRDLQKRVFELELKLNRSQNSTTGLLQERDSLIAELQTQLNTLVHNFEVSQKHIRVLRRHIYSMSNGNVTPPTTNVRNVRLDSTA